jgi:hypothetical protein
MHIEAMLTASRITEIVLIDATGKEHKVPMNFSKSYEASIEIELSDLDTLTK